MSGHRFTGQRILNFFRRSNPGEQLNRIYLDMQRQLADARRVTAVAVAAEKRLLQSLQTQEQRVQECEERAYQALQRGDEDLARRETDRWSSEEEYHRVLARELARRREAQADLQSTLQQLQQRTEEAQRKKTILLERLREPDARKQIHEFLDQVGDVSSLDAFAILEDLTRPIPERDPVAEVDALTAPTATEKLEELKRRLRESPGTTPETAPGEEPPR